MEGDRRGHDSMRNEKTSRSLYVKVNSSAAPSFQHDSMSSTLCRLISFSGFFFTRHKFSLSQFRRIDTIFFFFYPAESILFFAK